MKLINIKIADAKLSATNAKGRTEGKSFEELVASIKEKGVLTPILVREQSKGQYEVIAGNRRLAAAKSAGLTEIPAQLVEMNDIEAREAQIVENLQRENIHPLDEGESYRQLFEGHHQEIKTIAAKVGKSETYVRQRVFLTNLDEKVKKAYRDGKINDGFAVEIAKLDPKDQPAALKYAEDQASSIKDLQSYISKEIQKPMQYQPWVGNPELEIVVGPCQECPPNRSSLFGDVKEGNCTTFKCWERKMKAYINHRIKMEGLVKISEEYHYRSDIDKNPVLAQNEYKGLSTKTKDHCEFAKQGIVVEGANIGNVRWICADKKCKKHHSENSTGYAETQAEKEKRRKEAEKERIAAEEMKKKENSKILGALKNITLPLTEKVSGIMIQLMVDDSREDELKPLCERHGWNPVVKEEKSYMDEKKIMKRKNWPETILKQAAEMNGEDQLRLIFEIMLQTVWTEPRDKAIKALSNK